MANISQYLKGGTSLQKASVFDRPGSNGYWQRRVYRTPGTYTFTADRDGNVKIQAIGAAAGAQNSFGGPSGSYGEKKLAVKKGDTLTIVVGAGSAGTTAVNTASAQAGTTSISGSPVGGTPLVLTGAAGSPNASGPAGPPGNFSGPWDVAYPGAPHFVGGAAAGSPCSASPRGPGRTGNGSAGAPGWGEVGSGLSGGPSISGPGSRYELRSDVDLDFWDLANAENAAAAYTAAAGLPSGVGAGTARGQPAAASLIGGGTGHTTGGGAPKSGHGAGGGTVNSSGAKGGDGGDAIVFIFFDEGTA